jgi:hypothetical protein
MASSVSHGEAVECRPKARKIEGIKLALSVAATRISSRAPRLSEGSEMPVLSGAVPPLLTLREFDFRWEGAGVGREPSRGTTMDTELPMPTPLDLCTNRQERLDGQKSS